MRVVDLIAKKRDGLALEAKDIKFIIDAYTKDELPDYQIAAWLMAVYFRGMTGEETASLTTIMAQSGDIADLSSVPGIKVDKHSTGGVADTTTLVLAPLVAAAGVPVAKMSGRGLGFTGGTIDKLESIPGFQTTLSQKEFISNLQRFQIAITGQSARIAPADGKLYALRDVTATVESIPLIASSIMSKKIAAGADKIVLDVKVGTGAFMKNLDEAISLARTMVNIGFLVGRETVAIISNMNEPLGQAVGNSLEVIEAVEVLKGRGPTALRDVCLILGAHMLLLAAKVSTVEKGREILDNLISSGCALAKFKEFVAAQGGNPAIADDYRLLPHAQFTSEVISPTSGYIGEIDAARVGYSAMLLGAGRAKKGDVIDLGAGVVMRCKVGEYVDAGDVLATLYTNDKQRLSLAESEMKTAIRLVDRQQRSSSLILGIVDKEGYRPFV